MSFDRTVWPADNDRVVRILPGAKGDPMLALGGYAVVILEHDWQHWLVEFGNGYQGVIAKGRCVDTTAYAARNHKPPQRSTPKAKERKEAIRAESGTELTIFDVLE